MTPTEQDKELDEILVELLGSPLKSDVTWRALPEDPYGVRQLADTSRTTTRIIEPIPESYETIKRQFKRLPEAKAKLQRLMVEARIDELKHLIDDDGIWYQDMTRQFPQKIRLEERIKELEV